MITAGQLYEQIKAEHAERGPDRRPIDERLTDLGNGTMLCIRRGQGVTHEDLDAVFEFTEFLRRARQPRCYRSVIGAMVHGPGCRCTVEGPV